MFAEQRKAVATLQDKPIPAILDWLESFRSWYHSGPGYDPIDLSPEMRQAGFALINFPNELIHSWLIDARASGQCPQA